mmetsp:Transcript_4246/g.6912  ORF Transcript_4246/g.6912 Transcript_4246/m.6912 type:complete len:484 (-) Transcript_4246:215-1666(-)
MLRELVCVVAVAASLRTETTTPCASGFLSTPCPLVRSTITTTPLPCPTIASPCGELAIFGARVVLAQSVGSPGSMVTATPSVSIETTMTTTPAPCFSTSKKPCPILISTSTTTPCVATRMDALASAGARDTPDRASSATAAVFGSTVTTTPLPCPTSATPCTVTTTPCIIATMVSTVTPTPVPCPTTALPWGALAIAGSHFDLAQGSPSRLKATTTIATTSVVTTIAMATATVTTTTTATTTSSTTTITTSSTSRTTTTAIATTTFDSHVGLAISGASMHAKLLSSRSHSVEHAKTTLRRKEHESKHSARIGNSFLSLVTWLLMLLLLILLIAGWHCCCRSKGKSPSISPNVTEEVPLLAGDLTKPTELETILETAREAIPVASASRSAEEPYEDPETVLNIAHEAHRMESARTVDDAPAYVISSTELPVAVDVAPIQEPENLVAVETRDGPMESASLDRHREIPPVGEAPKNTGCCACRGRH